MARAAPARNRAGTTIEPMPPSSRRSGATTDHENAGDIDHAWDVDPRADPRLTAEGLVSDVTCTVPWRVDDFEAIEVYLDPALSDRVDEICATITSLAAAHRDIDTLTAAILGLGRLGEYSAMVVDDPPDAASRGVVAVAVTVG